MHYRTVNDVQKAIAETEDAIRAIGLLAAVGLLASYGPARNASRLEPMNALREE